MSEGKATGKDSLTVAKPAPGPMDSETVKRVLSNIRLDQFASRLLTHFQLEAIRRAVELLDEYEAKEAKKDA